MTEELNILGKIAHKRALQPRKRKKKEPAWITCPICKKLKYTLYKIFDPIKKCNRWVCAHCKKNKKYLEDDENE